MKIIEFIKSFFSRKNFLPKIIALAFAILLWFYIGSKKVGSVSFNINVVPINLSADMVVTEFQKKTVVVTLRGNKEDIKNVSKKSIAVEVDLRNPVIGKLAKYDLNINFSEQYDSLKYELSDKKMFVLVDKKAVKRVPIRLKLEGNVEDSFVIVSTKMNPEYCTISGAESEINSIESVDTEPVVISGEKTNFKKSVRLSAANRDKIGFQPEFVTVNFMLAPEKDVMKISVPVTVRGAAHNYDYKVLSKSVDLFVKTEEGHRVETNEAEVYIDMTSYDIRYDQDMNSEGVAIKDFPVKVIFEKRKDISFVSIVPETVSVKIRRK
ncbi:MAG: YbbR-like domain-containing protein [Spirochaetes bacterium]|nr:YbbR-like domain-containing protein [Spirochaetota bacterium]